MLRVGGELAQHLSSTVAPLIIHDLPVVLWWPDDVPFGSPVFEELAAECDRLFVDSGGFRNDGIARLAAMADATHRGKVVHDIAWMRLELWRELVAGLFDHPLLQPELRRLTSVRVDLARPGSVTRLTRAALFVGLAGRDARLAGRQADGPGPGRHLPGHDAVRPARDPHRVPAGRGHHRWARPGRSARSCASTWRRSSPAPRCGSGSPGSPTICWRTADWNGAQVARRPARLEAFDETPFLAEALDRTGHDRVFEAAVDRAVRLTATLVPDLEAVVALPADA